VSFSREEIAALNHADAVAHSDPLHKPRGFRSERGFTARSLQRGTYRHPPRRFRLWTDQEALEALAATNEGAYRLRSDLANNVLNLGQVIKGWAQKEGNGQGDTTVFNLARALYGADVIRTPEDADRLYKCLWRWARRGERAGLFRVRVLEGDRGARIGLRWELLDPRRDGPCSSAGSSVGHVRPRGDCQRRVLRPLPSHTSCQLHRRRETRLQRCERRHRPRFRRTGRQGVGRYTISFFDPQNRPGKRSFLPSSGRTAGTSARTHEAPHPTSGESAGERGAASAADDLRRECAAIGAGRTADTGRRALKRCLPILEHAARSGVPATVVGVVAFEVALGRRAKLTAGAARRILRSAAQADRVGGPGTGALLLVGAVRDWLAQPYGLRAGDAPRKLGYFARPLRARARQRRREWRAAR
jgi:hypothetical protein